MTTQVSVQDRILKPIEEVYDAIVDPEKMSGYFISRASKKIEKPETIIWYFDDYGVEFPIYIKKLTPNESIVFEWDASGKMATVEISLERKEANRTEVKITEVGWELTEEGVARALQQTQGWTDFICSLKAYLYTRINLRKGEF